IEQVCQAVPEAVFARLGPGDLLFIDSSHAVKIGSDVLAIYLDIVPKLGPDIYIHIHDISLPYLHSPDALDDYFGWQETALVLALLTHNERMAVLACMAALCQDHPRELAGFMPDFRPRSLIDGISPNSNAEGHYPSSLWLKTRPVMPS